jgi:hypothetical protein
MILTVATTAPLRAADSGCSVATVTASSMRLMRSMISASTRDQAAFQGVEVAAPGMGRPRRDTDAGQRGSDQARRGVFVDITGVEARAMHPVDAGRGQQHKVGAGETAAFLHDAVRQAQAVRQQQAFALVQREFAENHARSPR